MTEKSVKVFTKDLLTIANKIAIERNYNRQIDEDIVFDLPEDKVYPVTFDMEHEHIAGVLQDVPHVRVCLIVPEPPYDVEPWEIRRLQLDLDMDFYINLPVRVITYH